MNNYRKILAYFLIGCLFLFVAAAFGGKIRLKYGPAEGTLSTYRMKVRAFSAVTDFGKMASKNAPANFTTYGNFVFTSTVEKKDKDGAVTEKITYKESKLEMEVAVIRTPLDFSEKM